MINPTKYFLIIFTIFCFTILININESIATSPCIKIFSGAKIKLNNGEILKGYVIWSPYDDDKWSEVIWDSYINRAKKILFTKNVYVINTVRLMTDLDNQKVIDESDHGFYTAEESQEINSKDILSIDLIKLEHDDCVSPSTSSISLAMAKYSKTNKPIAAFCKQDMHKFGWGKCIISFNKKYTKTIIENKFDELVKLPLKSLNKDKLILHDYCDD